MVGGRRGGHITIIRAQRSRTRTQGRRNRMLAFHRRRWKSCPGERFNIQQPCVPKGGQNTRKADAHMSQK